MKALRELLIHQRLILGVFHQYKPGRRLDYWGAWYNFFTFITFADDTLRVFIVVVFFTS